MRNIAVMAGGDSSEYEVSLKSANNIVSALSEINEYCVFLISCKGNIRSYVDETGSLFEVDKNDFSITIGQEKITFDFVYITIHGTPGENGKLQGYLDMMNVPYSTGGVLNTSIGFNKYASKVFLQSYGILSPKGICMNKGEGYDEKSIISELGLPLFVKPNEGGSSFGISKVSEKSDFKRAVEKAFSECDNIVIEEAIDGKELTCGLFKFARGITVLPITEIQTNEEFFNYKAKYLGDSKEITPAIISEDSKKKIEDTSRIIYDKMGCRGIVRIDYILKDGELYFLEINLTPGMTDGSLVPQQIKVAGLSLSGVLEELIDKSF